MQERIDPSFFCMCVHVWVCVFAIVSTLQHQSMYAVQPEKHAAAYATLFLFLWFNTYCLKSQLIFILVDYFEFFADTLFSFFPTHSLKRTNACVTCTSFALPYSHTHTYSTTHLNFSSRGSRMLPAVHTRLALIIGNSHFSPSTG